MIKNANWISPRINMGRHCPGFLKDFSIHSGLVSALFSVTGTGVYYATVNGSRVGNYVLTPGFTSYRHRLQYQTYDVTNMLLGDNTLCIYLGNGWYRSRISEGAYFNNTDPAVIASLLLTYNDGSTELVVTDDSWSVFESQITFTDIYDGEIYDATLPERIIGSARINDVVSKSAIIPHEGEYVTEHERIKPINEIITPKGERVLDFGQNLAGYVEFSVNAYEGDKVTLSFAEILDADGNFYTENYRSAKCVCDYKCKDGINTHHAVFTFYGFRYIRIDEAPQNTTTDCFTAVAIYSDMERTGYIESGNEKLNRLFQNTLWSQRGNFIDIPTDCPQRDERQGWTGDAQVFAKTACYNYNAQTFFKKWLGDLRAEQHHNGAIPEVIPSTFFDSIFSTAWGDAATVIPWTLYEMFGDRDTLRDSYRSMCGWVDYITHDTKTKYLWTYDKENGTQPSHHFGDWLGLDAPLGSYKGLSRDELIASAFYAYSTELVIHAGRVLGVDVSYYTDLYDNIVKTFRSVYSDYKTQTECVLALYFKLAEDRNTVAKQLNDMIVENGYRLKTGFVGTPYLLHALSENGYIDTAYRLLLQEEYPSWLYEVNMGATTIWEHWDGVKPDGSFWSSDMNSYNHYAYGSVFDWVYMVAGGINPIESKPGFEEVLIAPHPSAILGSLCVEYKSKYGVIKSIWSVENNVVHYSIDTPVKATVILNNEEQALNPGHYEFDKKLK